MEGCAGTLATSRACLQFSQHPNFDGCENYPLYFVESLPSLVEPLAQKILNPNYYFVKKEGAVRTSKVLIKAMEAILTRHRVDNRAVLACLASVQIALVHIWNFGGNLYNNKALYDIYWHILLSQWYEEWQKQIFSMVFRHSWHWAAPLET